MEAILASFRETAKTNNKMLELLIKWDSMQNREPKPEDMPEPKPRVKQTRGKAKGSTQSQSQKHTRMK